MSHLTPFLRWNRGWDQFQVEPRLTPSRDAFAAEGFERARYARPSSKLQMNPYCPFGCDGPKTDCNCARKAEQAERDRLHERHETRNGTPGDCIITECRKEDGYGLGAHFCGEHSARMPCHIHGEERCRCMDVEDVETDWRADRDARLQRVDRSYDR